MRRNQKPLGIKPSKTLFVLLTAALGCGWASCSFGAAVFTEDFDSYSSSDLVGQGPWTQTGSSTTSPIQVSSGRAQLGTTGQDAYAAFGSSVAAVDGTSLYYALTLNVISAQTTGDYFFHVSDPAGTTGNFYERLFARSSGAGFQIGLLDAAGTGSATTWGTTELSLNTDYRVVVVQNFVAGTFNNTFSLYVDPTDLSVEANNTPYLTHIWTSTSVGEPAQYSAANFRQGSSGSAAAVYVDNIAISQAFVDVAAVPEPSTWALATLAGFAFLGWFRSRK